MRNLQLRLILSTVALFSILTMTLTANAAPVKFGQVRQIINAKPGKAKTNAFARLSLINAELGVTGEDDDKNKKDDKNKAAAPTDGQTTPTTQQDDRVITETTSEIVEDEVCDCVKGITVTKPGFPKFALLGLGAIPLLFLIPRDKDTPTPTPTLPTTETPTPPTTETPTPETPTPTPPTTVTPTPPEPVPEPMTILLFGTGLASVGMAARKKFGKKAKEEKTEE